MQPFLSVAVTSKLKVPFAVGVPVSLPVEEARFRPVGWVPLVMANVAGAAPPDCVIVWL